MKTTIFAAFLLAVGVVHWTPMAEAQAAGQSEKVAEKVPERSADKAPGKAADKAASKVQTIEGMLSNFDGQQRVMWIKIADNSQMQFTYTAETPLVGASRQLQVGDHLKVSYEAADGVNKAVSVELMPA